MNRPILSDSHPLRRHASWLLLVLVAAAVVVAHFLAVARCPLPVYGTHGAEYLEHEARDGCIRQLDDEPTALLLIRFPRHLTQLDEGYPPLLHLSAVLWARVAGDGIRAAIHLNLVFLLLLAAATAAAGRNLGILTRGDLDREAQRWTAALAAVTVLLLPAIFATARRYYYDLPMTAWCALALAGLLGAHRSTWWLLAAVVGSGAALLTKWTAGFYLAPMWIMAAVLVLRRPPRIKGATRLAIAGVLVLALCWPCLRSSSTVRDALGPISETLGAVWTVPRLSHGNSFDAALNTSAHIQPVDLGSFAGWRHLSRRLGFYAGGLTRSSVGPLMALALLACAGVGRRGWPAVALVAGVGLPPILWLALRVDVLDERFLLPILPLVAAGIAAAWGRAGATPWRTGALALVLIAGALQLAHVGGGLPMGAVVGPRASVQDRGWNLVRGARCTPFEEVEEVALTACDVQADGGRVALSGAAALHFGLGWYLTRTCDQDEAWVMPDDQVLALPRMAEDREPRPRTAWMLDHHPLGWPAPAHRVDMRTGDPAVLYLAILPGVEEPEKPLTMPDRAGDNRIR